MIFNQTRGGNPPGHGWRPGLLLACACALSGPAHGQTAQESGQADGDAYQDQLIDPDIAPLPPLESLEREEQPLPWIFGADVRYGLRDEGGTRTTEQGALLRYQRDTTNYGRIDLEILALDSQSDNPLLADGASGQFTLTQTRFPVGGDWFADSGLGVQRSVSGELVASSYRFYLPSSIINGATTRVSDGDQEWRFTWGETGRLEGLYSRVFDSENASLVGGGYSRGLGGDWQFAAEFWQLNANRGGDSVGNLALAVGRGASDEVNSDRLHLLAEDDGDLGAWYDGERQHGLWRHRFGTYTLADGLQWQDTAIQNNRDGLYYRGDYSTLRSQYTVGVDAGRTRDLNLADYRVFGAADWRLGSFQRVGTQLSAGSTELRPLTDTDTGTQDSWQADLYYDQQLSWFDQRLELTTVQSSGAFDSTTNRLAVDQFWNLRALDGLATRLELERREEPDLTTDTARVGATYRHRFANNLTLDTSLLAVRQDAGGEANTTANATVSLDWPFSEHWSLGLNAIYNEVASVRTGLTPETGNVMLGKQLFVSLSYGASGGRPGRVLGAGNSENGVGRITGVVYFDDNRDGRRSPGEKGAEGVVVRLDASATTVTDSDGRFEFWPVAAGDHRLQVVEESVPLPWAPARPMITGVDARGQAFADLALQRINE